jgi:DNA-binding NarL/FixJ family response regulator
MSTRVLLVGQGLFRDGLEHTLAQEPTVTIVGSATTWSEAQALVARLNPDVLIVDHAATALHQADMTPVLGTADQPLKVIHLTLAENKMVVYDQRQITNVSLTDLLQALKSSSQG